MKPHHLALALFGALIGTAAHGQLLSERTDGLQRVCIYRSSAGLINDRLATREYRVGLAQNCPLLPPATDPSSSMPPTARLTREALAGSTERSCTYEEGGRIWQVAIPAGRNCPLAAGMLAGASTSRQ